MPFLKAFQINTEKDFSAKDVYITTIVVTYWYHPQLVVDGVPVFDADGKPILVMDVTIEANLLPVKIGIGAWHIKLWFDSDTFPDWAHQMNVV